MWNQTNILPLIKKLMINILNLKSANKQSHN